MNELWEPLMPIGEIVPNDFENRDLMLISMAQVDIIVQDIMDESHLPICEMSRETKLALAKYLYDQL